MKQKLKMNYELHNDELKVKLGYTIVCSKA